MVFNWISTVFKIFAQKPSVCLLLLAFLMIALGLGRISLALGIVTSISTLFVTVGIIAQIDQSQDFQFSRVLRQHLPLSITLALLLMGFWFVFQTVSNIVNHQAEAIVDFFFDWQLTAEATNDKSLLRLTSWWYASAITGLIFTWLMLCSFASWFCYPLMIFKSYSYSLAREEGKKLFRENARLLYRLQTTMIILTLLCVGLLPILIPVLFMLYSGLMYVTYRDLSPNRDSQLLT